MKGPAVPAAGSILRWLALAAFLAAVAIGLWLLAAGPPLVIGVMLLAWLIAAGVEWLAWRDERRFPSRPELREQPPAQPPPAEPSDDVADVQVHEEEPSEVAVAAEPLARPQPPGSAVESPPPPAAGPPLAPAPRLGSDDPEESATPREELQLRAVPPAARPPVPEPVAAEPPAAAERNVVAFPAHAREPREWNLWELERLAHEQRDRHPERFDEWFHLFLHLRPYASPEGVLPREFDGLVRESFGELLETRA